MKLSTSLHCCNPISFTVSFVASLTKIHIHTHVPFNVFKLKITLIAFPSRITFAGHPERDVSIANSLSHIASARHPWQKPPHPVTFTGPARSYLTRPRSTTDPDDSHPVPSLSGVSLSEESGTCVWLCSVSICRRHRLQIH